MKTLYILIGTIGSGKSFWSKNYVEKNSNTVIVCRDNLREMIYGKYLFLPEKESFIKEITINCVKTALENNFDVIIDETNLTREKREKFIDFVKEKTNIKFNYRYIYFYPLENAVDKRMESNSRGYTREKWQEVFDQMNKIIELPGVEEINKEGCLGLTIFHSEENVRNKTYYF